MAIPKSIRRARTIAATVNCTGPRACYDEGKRAAETLAFDFLRAGRADVRVARIFNTYGPRMQADDGRVVSNFIDQLLGGRDVTIYGDGSQTRCFCFVDDTVEGLLRLMDSDGAAGVAGQPRRPARNDGARAGGDDHRPDRCQDHTLSSSHCPKTIPAAAARTSAGRSICSAGSRRVSLEERPDEDDCVV